MTRFLFAYGTLRRVVGHPMGAMLARASTYAGEGTVAARMFDLGHYPGIVLSPHADERVAGDVFELEPASAPDLLRKLDAYEGVCPETSPPGEYTRQVVDAQLSDGRIVQAWVYVLADSAPDCPRILAWPRDSGQ